MRWQWGVATSVSQPLSLCQEIAIIFLYLLFRSPTHFSHITCTCLRSPQLPTRKRSIVHSPRKNKHSRLLAAAAPALPPPPRSQRRWPHSPLPLLRSSRPAGCAYPGRRSGHADPGPRAHADAAQSVLEAAGREKFAARVEGTGAPLFEGKSRMFLPSRMIFTPFTIFPTRAPSPHPPTRACVAPALPCTPNCSGRVPAAPHSPPPPLMTPREEGAKGAEEAEKAAPRALCLRCCRPGRGSTCAARGGTSRSWRRRCQVRLLSRPPLSSLLSSSALFPFSRHPHVLTLPHPTTPHNAPRSQDSATPRPSCSAGGPTPACAMGTEARRSTWCVPGAAAVLKVPEVLVVLVVLAEGWRGRGRGWWPCGRCCSRPWWRRRVCVRFSPRGTAAAAASFARCPRPPPRLLALSTQRRSCRWSIGRGRRPCMRRCRPCG